MASLGHSLLILLTIVMLRGKLSQGGTAGNRTQDPDAVAASLGANTVLFTRIGSTAIRTSFAHLVVPMQIPALKKSFDQLSDLIKGYQHTSNWHERDYQHEANRLERLKARIDILQHLADSHVRPSHFEEYDDQNQFRDALVKSLNGTNQWKPEKEVIKRLDDVAGDVTSAGREKRQAVDSALALVKLAGFGLNLYNQAQIRNIKEAASQGE